MKRILTVLLAAMICVSCSACSLFNKQESSKNQESKQISLMASPFIPDIPLDDLTSAAEENSNASTATSSKRSIDDYIDKVLQELDAAGEDLDNDYTTGAIYSEGTNIMVFEYTFRETNAGYEKEDIAAYCESVFDDNQEQYQKVVTEMNGYVGEPCKLKVKYVNPDGSVVAERIFE